LFTFVAYNSTYLSSRNSILEMDRDPNRSLNLQTHQDQYHLNETGMSWLSSHFTESSSSGEKPRLEQDQDPPSDNQQSVNTHSINPFYKKIYSF
jgi:hypothetical protein